MSGLFASRTVGRIVIGLFLAVWLGMLGTRTLVPTDEGRYAEMPREMVATGDWVTPRLNGIKYFEKPPLQVWATAAAFTVFGLGEWQARLWTGLCGLFGVLLVWYTGRRLFDERLGLAAAMVLASSFWWAGLGHVLTLDMGLSGMMTLALCGLLLGQNPRAEEKEKRNWMLLCWAGMALAVMSKGLIGLVLPGAVLVLYTVAARDWRIWTRLHLGLGLLVFFAITTPWFVLVSLKNPEFPRFFFIHEHFERFTSKVHRREGPWYYFIPLLILGITPWLTVLAQGLWQGTKDKAAGFQPYKLLAIWAGFIFFFFSISGSKLPSYILPIFPALALLMAPVLLAGGRQTFYVAGGLLAAMGAAALAYAPLISSGNLEAIEKAYYEAAVPWAVVAGLVMLLAGALTIAHARRGGDALRATFLLAAGGFLAGQLALMATEPYGKYRAGLPLIAPMQAELGPEVKLYGVGIYDQTLPFYLRRTMTLVLHPDELEFGLQQEPQLWHPQFETFAAEWNNGKKAVALIHPARWTMFQASGLPYRIVAQDTRRIVVTNDLKK